ncbi:hypothetical protein D3C81_1582240 [compost metagenome]
MPGTLSSTVRYRCCSTPEPDALAIFQAVQGLQRVTFAGACHAFAILNQEQRPVMGTVDQAGTVIEKCVRLPVQGDTPVRAAVAIQVHTALTTHAEQFAAVYAEGAAMALGQCCGSTKEVHLQERLVKQVMA